MSQELSTISSTNSIIKQGDNHYVSLYTDTLTKKGIATATARLMQAFPELDTGFYNILTDRVLEKGFTDMQFLDAVNNVIDTCEYPKPVIGKFLSWDKKETLLTYNQMVNMAQEIGGSVWKAYDVIKIDGATFWKKKTK